MEQEDYKVYFLPQLGQGDESVTVTRWLVNNKSYVIYDQAVLEFETDKVCFEITAHRTGIITQAFPLGEKALIGDPLFRIDDPEPVKTVEDFINDFEDMDPEEKEATIKFKLPRI
jgi:pyruvate/2-oxoglutarate dehydrogenase complex dihydrolipoamide acyltransferase (E2) component